MTVYIMFDYSSEPKPATVVDFNFIVDSKVKYIGTQNGYDIYKSLENKLFACKE